MRTQPGIVTAVRRRLHVGRNPLVRLSDRVEAALVIGLVLLALLAIPFAVAMGSEAYDAGLRRAGEESANRHEATAVLVADAPPAQVRFDGVPVEETVKVHARWTVPGGPVREGVVTVDPGLATGDEIPIWLDAKGNAVDAPVARADAVGQGVGVGVAFWLVCVMLLTSVFLAGRSMLGRLRDAGWEREWRRASEKWTAA
ncbi:hypothetical protein [Amycolatopsis sp. TNS106]|uniref:Rv1733c family protein n=1 Tax=Amycolatopsis sp. TNS106 TaxID=2861750 RepID=UPI001C59A3EC|nr:hypothetical protein [Amycolatopsis sp. TNS106]QXV56494.1 hypothetical protein CVV72_05320 [Amycolatopsis sp. TNS106]